MLSSSYFDESERAATLGQTRSVPASGLGWKTVELFLLVGVAVTIASLPLGWIELGTIAGKRLRPVHLPIGLMFLACLAPRMWRIRLTSVRPDIIAMYLIYAGFLVAAAFSMLPAHNHSGGVNQLVKAIIYFGCFAFTTRLFTLLLRDSEPRFCRAVFVGCAIGTTLFLGSATYVFAQQGRNLAVEYFAAMQSGDVNDLFRGFYPQLFNYAKSGQANASPDDAEYVATHLRHTIMGAFILSFILLRAVGPAIATGRHANWTRWGSLLLQAFALFVVITSVSRSSIIAMGAVVFGGVALSGWRLKRWRVRPEFLVAVLLVVAVVGYVSITYLGGMSTVLQDRFSNLDENPRIPMYEHAIREIAERPIWGHGFATRLDHNKSLRVHNFLIAAWYEGGVIAFLLACLFLGVLLLVWFSRCRYAVHSEKWRLGLAPAWILMLPVWPLLRSMVAGDGGLFAFVDWIFLAFFVAAMLVQEGRASDSARERSSPV